MTLQKKVIIRKLSGKIRTIVRDWNLDDIDAQISNVKRWLSNFEPEEIPIIINILPFLQIKRDLDTNNALHSIAEHLNHNFNHNLNDIYFAPLSIDPASSGSQFIYPLSRIIAHEGCTYEDSYKSANICNVKALVFIDDMIGSGRQAAKFYTKHLKDLSIPCYYYSLYGYQTGLDYLRKNSGFKLVITPNIVIEKDKIFSSSSKLTMKDECRKIAEKYGKLLYPAHPLGYENSQAMLCFTNNCPNNTLPIIWAGYKNEMSNRMAWNPLFERRKMNSGNMLPKKPGSNRKKCECPVELVNYFFDSVMSEKFEEAFYCFTQNFREEKYKGKDNLQYFRDGYKNTDSLKGRPLTLVIHDSKPYARILIHYTETANVFKFKDLHEISFAKTRDLRKVNARINEFVSTLKKLNAAPERIGEIPLYHFFSANAVEDACWTCGIDSATQVKEFHAQRKAIARVKYIDCKYFPDLGWQINIITPVFPTSEPYN